MHDGGNLDRRQALAAVVDQRPLVGLPAQRHRGRHLLAVLLVRDAEAGGVGDRRMREQGVLDLAGRDVLAAADDQLLDAPDEPQVAVLEDALVARPEPAVAERLGVRLRVRQVAGSEARAAR